MRKYIFLDIDGTLFSSKLGGIPESALEAIEQAQRLGHKIFLCTGRSLAEVAQYLDIKVDGFIFGAGAMVYCDGKRIYDHPINSHDIARIKRLVKKHGLGYCLEGNAGAYCSKEGYEVLLRYFAGGETDREKQIEKITANCTYPEVFGSEENDQIYKVAVTGTKWEPDFPLLQQAIEEPFLFTKVVDLPDSRVFIAEITDKNINKATGIDVILDHYQADVFATIGIGDSANDLPMLKKCAVGIAMGNGAQEAKDAADYVTTDILEHGIWNAFVEYGLVEGEKR